MDNQTNVTSQYIFRPSIWYSNLVTSGFLGVITWYIVIALIFYAEKATKEKKHSFRQLSLEKKFAVLSKRTCIIIGIVFLLRHCNGFGRMLFEYNAVFVNNTTEFDQTLDYTSICRSFVMLDNITLTVGTGLVYLFLWLKQRVFYIHPCLKVLNNKILQSISNGIMIMWILYYFTFYFCYFFLVQYHFNKQGGCLVTESSHDTYFFLIVSWTAASVLMQTILLGLFIHPMLKRSSWQSNPNHERRNRLRKRVKKAILLTSICLATNLLSILATQFLFVKNANAVSFPFSLNLEINLLVTIACFDHWKKMLWPWNLKPGKDSHLGRRKSNAITSMSTMSTRDHGNLASVVSVA